MNGARRIEHALAITLVGFAMGCGIDSSGLSREESLLPDASSTEVAIDGALRDSAEPDVFADDTQLDDTSAVDTTAADTLVTDALLDEAPSCDTTGCGVLPTGTKRFALVDRAIACPPGFKATDVYEGTGGNGCECTCSLTSSPTCAATGALTTALGSAACGLAGPTLYPSGSGVCTAFPGSASLQAFFKGNAPGAYGGSCSPTPTTDKTAVARPRRLCEPAAGACTGDVCGTPFTECIEGATTCPASFPNARKIGTDVYLSCPACYCTVAATCTGTASFFNGPSCGGTPQKLAVDGTCDASTAANPGSFQYVPNAPTAACKPSFSAVPGTRTFALPRNLCCR